MPAIRTTIDADLQSLLTAIYTQNYLVVNDYMYTDDTGNLLVYSAKLECSQGSKGTYLKLETKTDKKTSQKYIGHGATVNGLPLANFADAKPSDNIGEFGDCALLLYEDLKTQQAIRAAALSKGMSICSYVRKLNEYWDNVEQEILVTMLPAISLNSELYCFPNLSAYIGSAQGKIQATDSGQMNLYFLIENYRYDYNQTDLPNSIIPLTSVTPVPPLIDVITAYTEARIADLIYIYELYYPDRERAFSNFANAEIYSGKFIANLNHMKFMTYMLAEDKYTKKIIDVMTNHRTFHLQINDDPGVAYFNAGTSFIVMTEITVKRNETIPYKVFFHEFGHAIDYYEGSGTKFYSEKFLFEQWELSTTISLTASNVAVCSYTSRKVKKTIQGWAESDVKYLVYRIGVDVVNNPLDPVIAAMSVPDRFNELVNVINNHLFVGDGIKKTRTGATAAIYDEIVNKANAEMTDQYNIINIGHDICGGISGNQIGGGHVYNYWFYDIGDKAVTKGRKSVGDRKTEINMEAFAGFFEYKALGISYGIDPARKVIPKTIAALEGMLKDIL